MFEDTSMDGHGQCGSILNGATFYCNRLPTKLPTVAVFQHHQFTTAGGGSMPASERNTVPLSQRDDLMSSCKHKRKHSEAGGQGTHTAPAPAMSSVQSQSHCACTHLALQGREWPWGSHPTATSRIVKVAMVKYYYEAIAEIRRVDDLFHVCTDVG